MQLLAPRGQQGAQPPVLALGGEGRGKKAKHQHAKHTRITTIDGKTLEKEQE